MVQALGLDPEEFLVPVPGTLALHLHKPYKKAITPNIELAFDDVDTADGQNLA